MQPGKDIRTDSRLWLLCGSGVFVLLGFFDPLPGIKGNPGPLWTWGVAVIVGSEQNEGALLVLPSILFYVAVYGTLSILFGWAIQACIVATLSLTKALKKRISSPN